MTGAITDRRTALYRLYDADGTLLYVGITYDPTARFYQHAADKSWWPTVARREVVWHDTRDEAGATEARAIIEESPLWNIATPDENGRYQTGGGRPRWETKTEDQQQLLDRLEAVSAELARLRAWKPNEYGPLWTAINHAISVGVPKDVIAEHAKPAGISRATLYRRLAELRGPNGEEGASSS